MRGEDLHQDHLYSYVSPEQRVPANHPLRPIRQMANTVLERLSPKLNPLYAAVGRPSIPPEKLLRALLLQVLYTLRSERLLMEGSASLELNTRKLSSSMRLSSTQVCGSVSCIWRDF